ncbi:hypothetical protein ACHHYP_08168 [Achlya hypogyna]|uniref:RNA ligase domain-containing protein n=1 Tax=Achlya hypogyna TaxID=1202772 RepID=A0A1V9YPN9_ACHHY|nr:hypothetical protein ACHHYP_08168 [Achlya hypogyna]
MISFPSISQYRHVVAAVTDHTQYGGRNADNQPVFDRTRPLPTLSFSGTVKLHGSNTAIVFYPDGRIGYQSRSRELVLGADYAGFVASMSACPAEVAALHLAARKLSGRVDATIAIFGEWCGGSIQGGVALVQLPKMFVYFALKIDDDWVDVAGLRTVEFPDARIYNILRFGSYDAKVSFATPEDAVDHLNALTAAVEAECPAGKALGVTGTGEGIVWTCTSPGFARDPRFWFKTKGTKHALQTTRPPAAALRPACIESADAFVREFVSENRLRQGVAVLIERGLVANNKQTGAFIKWVQDDIAKEERDTLHANGFDAKVVQASIATVARRWYLDAVKT